MLIKNNLGFYQSTLLSEIPALIHGYSTRGFGDMRDETNKKQFLDSLKLPYDRFVMARQVHGDRIYEVKNSREPAVPEADGLLVSDNGQSLSVGVHVADCVPMLLVDPQTKIICALHTGWRGTIRKIATKAVKAMKETGSRAQNIFVSIGPHIGMCCYDVKEDRARKFLDSYTNPKVVSIIENKWHLDLGYTNYLQLISSGISPHNIDAPPTCTSCQVNEFYSYRKDTKKTFGEIMGVIGFKN